MVDQLRIDVVVSGANEAAAALGRVVAIADQTSQAFIRAGQVVTAAQSGWQQQQANALNTANAMAGMATATTSATTAIASHTPALNNAATAATGAHRAYISLGAAVQALPGPFGALGQSLGLIHVATTQTTAATLAMGVAMASAGGAIAAGLGHAIGEAAQFQRTFAELGVVSQATGSQMEEMRAKALQLGAATVFNSQQVAEGMKELAQAGLTTTEVLAAIGPATTAAMLGNTTLEASTRMMANTMRQFGMEASQIPHIVDVMTVAAQGSTIRFNEFGNLIANLRGRTNELGLSFEEVIATEMAMTNAGIPAAAASTAIGTAIDRLAKNTGEAAKGARELGLTVFDADGKFVGWFNVLKQIEAALPNMTQQQQVHALSMLAGSRASGAFQAVLQATNTVMRDGQEVTLHGTQLLEGYRSQLENSTGAAQGMANVIGNTAVVDWQRFNASVQEANIQVGTGFLGAIQGVLPPITDLLNRFVTAPSNIHQTVGAIAAVTAAVLTLGGVVLTTSIAFTAFGPILLAAAAAAAPFVAAIVAIGAALSVLAVAWVNNWGGIRDGTEKAAEGIGGAVDATKGYLEKEKSYLDEVVIPAWKRYWDKKKGVGESQPSPATEGGGSGFDNPPPAPLRPAFGPGTEINTSEKPFGEGNALEYLSGQGAPGAAFVGTGVSQWGEKGHAIWEAIIGGVKDGSQEIPLGDVLYGALNPEQAALLVEATRRAMRPEWQKVEDDVRLASAESAKAYAEGWQGPIASASLTDFEHNIHDRLMQMAEEGRAGGVELFDRMKQGMLESSPEVAQAMDETVNGAAKRITTNLNGMGMEAGKVYTEGIIDGAVANIHAMLPNLPTEMDQIIRQAIHDKLDIRDTGVDMTKGFVEGAAEGMASLPDRIQGYLDETAKRSKDSGEITGLDYAKAFQDAIGKGDPAAAQGILELERATSFYGQTLKTVTPAQAAWLESIRQTSGVQAALDAGVANGTIKLIDYQAAVMGTAKAHAEAASKTQTHAEAVSKWLASTDPAIVAAGLWAQKVDQYADALARAHPEMAATVLAAKNMGDTETVVNAVMQAENLTRDQAIAKIQSETSARTANAAASKLEGEAANNKIQAMVAEAEATKTYQGLLKGLTDHQKMYVEAVKQVMGIEAALRASRELNSGLSVGTTMFGRPLSASEAAGQGPTQPLGAGVGGGIATGIAAGIMGGREAIGTAVNDMAAYAVGQAQNALGIASPSRVFAERVGRPIIEGIAQGISEHGTMISDALGEQVDRAVNETIIAAAPRPSTGAGGGPPANPLQALQNQAAMQAYNTPVINNGVNPALQLQILQNSQAIFQTNQEITRIERTNAQYAAQVNAALTTGNTSLMPTGPMPSPYASQIAQLQQQQQIQRGSVLQNQAAEQQFTSNQNARTERWGNIAAAQQEVLVQALARALQTPEFADVRSRTSGMLDTNVLNDPGVRARLDEFVRQEMAPALQAQAAAQAAAMAAMQERFAAYSQHVQDGQEALLEAQSQRAVEIQGAEREAILQGVEYIPATFHAMGQEAENARTQIAQAAAAEALQTSAANNAATAQQAAAEGLTIWNFGITGGAHTLEQWTTTLDEAGHTLQGLPVITDAAGNALGLFETSLMDTTEHMGPFSTSIQQATNLYTESGIRMARGLDGVMATVQAVASQAMSQASVQPDRYGNYHSPEEIARMGQNVEARELYHTYGYSAAQITALQGGEKLPAGQSYEPAGHGPLASSANAASSALTGLAQTTGEAANAAMGYAASSDAANAAHMALARQWSDKAFALGQGLDFMGAAAARAGLAAVMLGGDEEAASTAASEATEQWKLVAANAQALMAGQMRNAGVAGGVTAVGLNTTQIYGNPAGGGSGSGSAGGSNQGVTNLPPGTYYGLPVVSPVTGGTLRGYASGGPITEPSYIVPVRTGVASGIMAENGTEYITPSGGGSNGGGVQLNVYVTAGLGADEVLMRDRRLWEQLFDRQILPVGKSRRIF